MSMMIRTFNILCWNCRGISSGDTSTRLKRLIKKYSPTIAYLDHFCSKITHLWDWAAILAEGMSGGIIVLWRKDIGRVTPLAVTRKALYLIISSNPSSNHIVSVI